MARPTKAKALERLTNVLKRIEVLKKLPRFSPEFRKWRRDTEVAISNTFENESDHQKDFSRISYSLIAIHGNTPESEFQEAYVEGLENAASVLQSMLDEVEEYWERRRIGI